MNNRTIANNLGFVRSKNETQHEVVLHEILGVSSKLIYGENFESKKLS